MRLNGEDVWLHAAPLFHLVDVFAVYAITLVGGRHVLMPTFSAQAALVIMGEDISFAMVEVIKVDKAKYLFLRESIC